MKIYTIFKKILNFKLILFKPPKKKILIYDRSSEKFAQVLFKKNDIEFYDTRYESINIFVILFTLIKNGFKRFKLNYKINYFKFVSPKIIYTAIDNNIGFFKLKDIFPSPIYIADQKGMRDNIFYNECKNFLRKNPGITLNADIFFCFGLNEKKRLSKIINSEIFPLGNTVNNNFKYVRGRSKKKIKKIMYISQDPKLRFELEKSILEKLFLICEENNFQLYFLDRMRQNNKRFIEKSFRKNFFYISNNYEKHSGYKIFNSDYLYVNGHSTLGYELLSKNYKSISFNHTFLEHGLKKIYKNQGIFWSDKTKKNMSKLILKILDMPEKKWVKKTAKYRNDLMFFDKFNKEKKIIIKKYLKKNEKI